MSGNKGKSMIFNFKTTLVFYLICLLLFVPLGQAQLQTPLPVRMAPIENATCTSLRTKSDTSFSPGNSTFTAASLSPDGKSVATASNDGTVVVKNLETGNEIKIKHNGAVRSAFFSPDGKSVVTASEDATAIVKNLETGNEIKIKHNGTVRSASFSPDGKSVLTAPDDATAIVKNLETGSEIKIEHNGNVRSQFFSPDGELVLMMSDAKIKISVIKGPCVPDEISIKKKEDCSPQTLALMDLHKVSDFLIKDLCKKDFDEKSWGSVNFSSKELSEENAKNFLLRFQKPDGFIFEKHAPIFLAILKSDLFEKEPDLIMGVMQNIYAKSLNAYNDLISLYPKLLDLKSKSDATNSCLSQKEKETMNNATFKKLKEEVMGNKSNFTYTDALKYCLLTPILTNLASPQKNELLELMAVNLSEKAKRERLEDIFSSKLYKMSHESLKPLFGEKENPLTDITMSSTWSNATETQPIILGVNSIDGKTARNEYGFHVSRLPAIQNPINPTEVSQKISWSMGDKKYSADVELQKTEKGDFIPKGDGPDYESLWKDETLTGLIFVGTNLENETSKYVMYSYLSYYQDQGFEFKSEAGTFSNFPQFLEDQIKSGKLDYLSKEAHSDGDEKNLTRISPKAKFKEGTRTLPNGLKEKIYLVFPDPSDSSSTLLSNVDFGDWIKTREKNGQGQLVYLNRSCGSYQKAIHEIQEAASPLLLNIPSTTVVDSFGNSKTDAQYLLLESLRKRKSYKEMRKSLESNVGYINDSANHFIFPDEDEYKKLIVSKVINNPRVRIKILDQDNKPYSIEQFEH